MRIDAHTHGVDANRDENGKPIPPLFSYWKGGSTEKQKEHCRKHGIDRVLVLDYPHITFDLWKHFGDFIIPVCMVNPDETSPILIQDYFDQGAAGIKFIAPQLPYGDDRYLPLYRKVAENKGLAVFHTGFVATHLFDPGGLHGRKTYCDCEMMRPTTLCRVAQFVPDVKILMSHFGNPWWDEAFMVVNNYKNIYADLSGGSAVKRDLNLWKMLFAPNGIQEKKVIEKLCFATDGEPFCDGAYDNYPHFAFYDALYEILHLSEEQRYLIDRCNIEKLTTLE